MVEQPDTDAIRDMYADDAAEFPGGTAWQFMRLADALDAARAKSERRRVHIEELVDRAESAEARIAELEAPFHRVRPRPEGTCHRNLHYPPANSECCWDYR